MRVTRVLALVLIAVSALSFGLTIYNIQATKWNIGRGTWDGGWGNGNWWEGTWEFDIFGGEHYNWFFGYYYQSLMVTVNHSLWENLLTTGYYNPFPSAILGLYLLVCGIVFWFIKEENQRPSWFYNRDFSNNEFLADAVTLIGVGAFSLCFSIVLLYCEMAGNYILANFFHWSFFNWVFPLAFLGTVLLTLGMVALGFVIIENRRLPQFSEPQLSQRAPDKLKMHATRTLTKKEKNMILLLSASTCLLVYLWQIIGSMPISMNSDLVSFFMTQVFISAIVGIYVGIVAYILVKYR